MNNPMSEFTLRYVPGRYITRKELTRFVGVLLSKPINPGESPKIVDIGCAIGDMFGPLAVNVDIKSLEEMKSEAKSFHGDIEIPNYVQADAAALPFKDKEFDVAILSEILEHVDDPIAVIREAKRVAQFVYICVPNEYLWSPDKNPFSPAEQSGHKRHFTAETILSAAYAGGIDVVEFMDWQYSGWAYFIIIGE